MKNVKGYILPLWGKRAAEFDGGEEFAEAVDEFEYSRSRPLPCFIFMSHSGRDVYLTHIGMGSRGVRAGTGLRRLNLKEIYELDSAVSIEKITDHLHGSVKDRIASNAGGEGGLIPPTFLDDLIEVVSALAPDTSSLLLHYSSARTLRINRLGKQITKNLAEQKDAVATALSIAGIDRKELLGWDADAENHPVSYLDGLPQCKLREDPMVINDLHHMPGFSAVREHMHGTVIFQNDTTTLTVTLANRLPLEEQTGADLIYFNEKYSCFIMVQYKAMEREAGQDAVYRFPNAQLDEEISRMRVMLDELAKITGDGTADGYRLNENPFFLKVCPRIQFEPDNIGLVKGMYLPLDYWECLSGHPEMEGPRGGKRLTYGNVRRYFTNTDFVAIAKGGWIGTNIDQSALLKDLIRGILESGKAVVFAVEEPKTSQSLDNRVEAAAYVFESDTDVSGPQLRVNPNS